MNGNYEKLGLHKIVQSSYLNEQGRLIFEYIVIRYYVVTIQNEKPPT